MKKFLIACLFISIAIFATELQYNTEFENLEGGDTIDVDLHLHAPLDSIKNIINGNITNVNISDTAKFRQNKIDSVQYNTTDWIHAYTKLWQLWSGGTWTGRFPRGAYLYLNDTNANDEDFRIYDDSSNLILKVNDDSTYTSNFICDTARADSIYTSKLVVADSASIGKLKGNIPITGRIEPYTYTYYGAETATISSNTLTVTRGLVIAATEASAAVDTITSISGLNAGSRLILYTIADNRDVLLVDDNNVLDLGADFLLDNTHDRIELQKMGSGWVELWSKNNQ